MGSIRTLVFLTGGGLACIFFLSAGWIFRAMGIPAAAARPAAEYLRITALGIPFLSAYNFYSAVAKAGGDARTPVRDMSVSCLMNIVLDYVFVVILRLGIRGAACTARIPSWRDKHRAEWSLRCQYVLYTGSDQPVWHQ